MAQSRHASRALPRPQSLYGDDITSTGSPSSRSGPTNTSETRQRQSRRDEVRWSTCLTPIFVATPNLDTNNLMPVFTC